MMTARAVEMSDFDLQFSEFYAIHYIEIVLLLNNGTDDLIRVDHVGRITQELLNVDNLKPLS